MVDFELLSNNIVDLLREALFYSEWYVTRPRFELVPSTKLQVSLQSVSIMQFCSAIYYHAKYFCKNLYI
jgi:hypothetical protein